MGQPKLRDYLVALLLFASSVAALGLAQRQQGVMRDEATYFQAGERYWGWFETIGRIGFGRALTPGVIASHFSINNEHPVLCKVLFGLSWHLLAGSPTKAGGPPFPAAGENQHAGLMDEISAFRLPGWLFTGLAVALLYLFGLRIESRTAGLAAALLYLTIPRIFFHGQLACFDSPIVTMWLLTVYAYLRALERARWGILAGICFGLALATKHNAWFLPPLLLLHYLLVVRPDVSLRPLHLPRLPLVFLSLAILGPAVFFAHWPWLWFDTVAHLKGYFGFHLHHSYYNIEYLGQNLGMPPLPASYPFVLTLFTVPATTLALALGGAAITLRRPLLGLLARFSPRVKPPLEEERWRTPARRSWLRPGKGLDPRLGFLLLLNACFPLLLIALPSTPKFGGTKHWLPAYPFIALLAGLALSRLLAGAAVQRWIAAGGRHPLRRLAPLALCLALAVPGALTTAFSHPYGLTGYNALAGSAPGGADLGLSRQFWGYATRQLLPWMNAALPPNTRVYFHDTNHDSLSAYRRDGLLRPDIVNAGMEKPAIEASDYALVLHELHFNKYDYWIWNAYQTGAPVRVLDLDGVPVVSVYRRPVKEGGNPRAP